MSEKLMSLLSRKKSDNDKDKVPPTAAAKPMVETVDTIESLDECQESWKELSQIKSTCPVIVCILPHVAQDFVASVLLAIGAYPLIAEDSDDVEKYITTSCGILLDTSARKELVQTVIDNYVVGTTPLIVVAWESGTNNSRKALTRKVINTCSPTLISGRLGDIHALGLDIMSIAEGIVDETDADVCPVPKVHKSQSCDITHENVAFPSPGNIRRASSPFERSSSPHIARKKENAQKIYSRQKTAIPQMVMKGQFRHQSIKDVSIPKALESAQKVANQSASFVHIYEIGVITEGEFFAEVNNTQMGFENLHSTIQCCAGIFAAVIACIEMEVEELTLEHCSHALSMYSVAAEESSATVSEKHETIPPGSLKVELIDYLHKLDEPTVRFKAQIVVHNSPPGS